MVCIFLAIRDAIIIRISVTFIQTRGLTFHTIWDAIPVTIFKKNNHKLPDFMIKFKGYRYSERANACYNSFFLIEATGADNNGITLVEAVLIHQIQLRCTCCRASVGKELNPVGVGNKIHARAHVTIDNYSVSYRGRS